MILAILFALEFGAVVNPGWVRYGEYVPPPPGEVYYTEFNAELIALDMVFVNTTLRTDIRPHNLLSWSPFWVTYDIALGVRLGIVEIGFRHYCTHPIQPYLTSYNLKIPTIEGSFEELYVRIGTLNKRSR